MPDNRSPIELKGMNAQETEEWIQLLGLQPYRARQVRLWLFQKLSTSFDEMTDLSRTDRELLKKNATITHLELVKTQISEDRTRKYLLKLWDGLYIESVLIPERDHYTLCISSQAGCAMGCRFCFTAQNGFNRNLSPAEIVEQVIMIKRSLSHPESLSNIVFMGMGEPLANYENVIKAIKNITGSDGMDFSHRKVTLSTSGLVPMIDRLGRDSVVNLAVSLNAANDATRTNLMPINKKYPLQQLLAACRNFPLPNRRMITFEYILIEGINDHDKDAAELAKLLAGVRAKINLIPLNACPELSMAPSSMKRILSFQDILVAKHYTAIIRKSKGADILAACGQLSGTKSP